MTTTVILAEHVGKKYTIGHHAATYKNYVALSEVLASRIKQTWVRTNKFLQGKQLTSGDAFEEVWVLNNLSFEIGQGESVGIIGRNGAGKSTLLKVLSRITEPSVGRVSIAGRVASLLEVGTGFHPELTGRENIFLNGAVLGMRRTEIKRKLNEIVDFAGVEQFLDTPVKRYSSGMYVRLAFSVAAHLDPEILLIDEVLAVGDAGFQRKCLGKMNETARSGRTLLFVSHNMASIQSLCPRCILIDKGEIVYDGDSASAVKRYMEQFESLGEQNSDLLQRSDRQGSGEARFTSIEFFDAGHNPVSHIAMGEPITVRVNYKLTSRDRPVISPMFAVLFTDRNGTIVTRAHSYESHHGPLPPLTSSGSISCTFASLPLMFGRYFVNLWLGEQRLTIDSIQAAATLDVTQKDVYQSGIPPHATEGGVFYAPHSWSAIVAKQN